MKFTQVTIKDIARELGVSPSTVSRALKDHPDISPNTKKAVNELAEKLNYQPNTVALSLRQSKTNTIGVIIPEIVHYFFSTVISGIEDVAYSAGYNVIITQSNESYEREKSDLKALFNSRVDGMLISLSRETTNFEHLENIHSKGVPMVFFDRFAQSINTSKVIVDDIGGAKEAVNHLIEQGCQKIAHLMGAKTLQICRERLKGYEDAIAAAGQKKNQDYIIECEEGSKEQGMQAMNQLLKLKDKPDAVFATNDMLALGAMIAIKEAGLKIPQDIALVGFSNWQFSGFVEPGLTTVDQPGFAMGQEATKLLIRQIEAGEDEINTETKVLKTQLIVRGSSLKGKAKK